MHILLAEDQPAIRFALTRNFNAAGYAYIAVENGKRLIEVFDEHPKTFDVIVTDHEMPLMTGLEVLRYIRESAYPNTPVVIYSTRQDIREEVEALRGIFVGKDLSTLTEVLQQLHP